VPPSVVCYRLFVVGDLSAVVAKNKTAATGILFLKIPEAVWWGGLQVSGFQCREVPESDILIFFSYVSTLNYLKILLDIFSSATWTPGLRTAFFSVIPGLTRTCPDPRSGFFPSFRT
jgi:hypothetical protein